MCQLFPVTFHGDTIFCIDYHGEPFAPMRPIVENMGLGWASQSQKLNVNKERWTVTNIVTVAQDGNEREMLCLPVRKLPAYLNSINPRKVRPELRAK
ncbi:MAG: phage antirepressor N-terminal domain-containing protein, partial [Desulfovibrio piger]|uniref:phage antirepressor N-terminal domain-containing protein n=2 Tax=Desulfovibrio TaxID=872 RepID=UPI00399A14C1